MTLKKNTEEPPQVGVANSASAFELKTRTVAKLRTIPVHMLRPHPLQPKERHSEANLIDLMASIQDLGLLEPPTAWKRSDGVYVILFGHRRIRSCQLLAMEGLLSDRVQVFVREDLSESESALLLAAEHTHRLEFSVIHTASVIGEAKRALASEGKTGLTVRRMAAILPWEKSTVDEYLKIDRALQDPRTEALVRSMDNESKSLIIKVLSQPRFSARLRALKAYAKGGPAAVHKILAAQKGGRPQKPISRSKRDQGYDLMIRFRPTMSAEMIDRALEEARTLTTDLERLREIRECSDE